MTSTQAIIERTLAGMGYELVDVEYAQDGLLRVYIDAPSGIALDDCEKVSRQLSHVLAVEDVDYARLEVSSPGVDRPLKKAADFERFAGAEVSVRLRRPFEGRRNFEGVLTLEGDGRYGLELIERPPEAAGAKGRKAGSKPGAKVAPGKATKAAKATKATKAQQSSQAEGAGAAGRKLVFVLDEIERARLVPKLKFQERRK
ncbi:MAG: ribosome maturation factor RimP [Burkholderiaceae bacterium]|jgi:ribosome maturation factor RimP|nr:ribosome maturation factor RimP [Burkholderiaceae bacterium]